jgi:predicted heme/steroid binding protein
MARNLTSEELEEFAGRKGVRRIAIENFLMSAPIDIGLAGNLYNLQRDAKSYGWNSKTQKAISDGLKLIFSS